ncbi:hypothetical protein AAFC00_006053 [Neodothiora populina]|uniref:NDT80 domain-containing protein n=1 Tax=Neodothiora populina TaxID=2781224 RepID=A0ABR3P6T2_9PEZI
MEGFDTSTMTYTGLSNLQYDTTPDAYSKMLMQPMDTFDHQSNFDAHTFAGSEDMYGLQQQQQQQAHQTTPSMKRFSGNIDDTFSDVVSAFENPIHQETNEGETTVDRDHKLLSFSIPNLEYVLLDYTYRQISISLTAQLHGMFFLAESPWASVMDGSGPPAELTCYRRNLFQITGNVTLPKTLHYILTSEGKQIPIVSQELVVTATESTEGNPVKLISVPWKTPANINPPSADDKTEREPPAIPLDMATLQEVDSEYATFPFQWKRLQFRIATANNGRRKELQQHFLLHLRVMATLATGGKVSIASAQSGAIIVRGRSPRNFQSRKDTPLTGAANHVRKSTVMPGQLPRVNSTDSNNRLTQQQQKQDLTSAPAKTEPAAGPPMSVASFFDPNDFSIPPGLFDNSLLPDPHQQSQRQTQQPRQGAMTALPQGPSGFDAAAVYALSSPDLSRPTPGANGVQAQVAQPISLSTPPATAAPQKLSLVDEETPKPISVSPKTTRYSPPKPQQQQQQQQQQQPPHNPHHNKSASQNTLTPSSMAQSVDNHISHPPKRVASMAPPPPASASNRLPSSFALNVVSSPDESADLLYEYFPLSLDDWMPPVDAVYRPHVVHHIKTVHTTGPEVGARSAARPGAGGAMGGGRGSISSGVWSGRSKRYFSEDVG